MKKQKIFWIWYVIVTILLSGIHPGYAQDDESERALMMFSDTFDGFLKNATAVRFGELDRPVKIENSLEVGYSRHFSDSLGMTVTTHVVYDAVYDVEGNLDVENEDDYRAYVDLREGFVDLTFDKFDLRLGKQQVVWGKTDGFRVVDAVNPLDLKEFVLGDFIDSRIPLWMAKLDYYFTMDFSLQAVIIPDMQFTKTAHAGSEYAFGSPEIPQGISPVINPIDEPDERFENTEYGLKFTGFYDGWDFTLNYLYGWDDDPVVKQSFDADTGTLTISPEHERMHILGGTAANVFWDTVIRGEFAAKVGKYLSVDDPGDPDMVVQKTLLNYALAFERDLFDVNWIAQFLQETILEYDDVMTDDEVNTMLTLRGSKYFRNDTLEVVTFIMYGVNEQEFLISPSVKYAINDSTKISVGADFFEGGDDDTLFGQFDDKDRLYVEVKYSF